MRIRASETQEITNICRDEFEEATQRVCERLKQFEERPASSNDEHMEGVRRFYEDLANKNWTKADEEALKSLDGKNESEIKDLMREGFRKAQLYPVPNFAYLVSVMKSETRSHLSLANLDAVSSDERERLANVLQKELMEAARDIAASLRLSNTNTDIVREQLEITQGNIIGRLTPLV